MNEPEFELTRDEAQELADAFRDIEQETGVKFTGPLWTWLNIAGALLSVYVPRVYMLRERARERREPARAPARQAAPEPAPEPAHPPAPGARAPREGLFGVPAVPIEPGPVISPTPQVSAVAEAPIIAAPDLAPIDPNGGRVMGIAPPVPEPAPLVNPEDLTP